KANCLNNYYTNSVDKLDHVKSPNLTSYVDCQYALDTFVLDENLIFNELRNVDCNKASGPDNISNVLIKNCALGLLKPLSIIYQKSLDMGTFPTCWKHANVTPIYKKKGPK